MDGEMKWREGIEWSNIWWEQANNKEVNRIALLGDSVTRGYRSKLNEKLGESYAVDICASSSQVTDTLLWREYRFFLECSEWKYGRIILQTGGQHGHTRRCCEDKVFAGQFKDAYLQLVCNIIAYCPDIVIVSSTPCRQKEDLKKWNYDRNAELMRRNEINMEIADEFHLPYIDIWTHLLQSDYEYNDYIHMKEEGNRFIANYLGQQIVGGK